MKKERVWWLLSNMEIGIIYFSEKSCNERLMNAVVTSCKGMYQKGELKLERAKVSFDQETIILSSNRTLSFDDFDTALVDKHDRNIVYLYGKDKLFVFYIMR